MKTKLTVAMFGLGLAICVMPMLAHHSVESQYDVNKIVTIQGVVTKIEWTNPHVHFWVDAENNDGSWELELPAPNALQKENPRDFVKLRDQVTVDLWRASKGWVQIGPRLNCDPSRRASSELPS